MVADDQVDDGIGASSPAGLYVYVLPPAQHWHGWHDLSKIHADDIFPQSDHWGMVEGMNSHPFRAEVDRLLYYGRKRAEETLGYDGDIAAGPFFSMLPSSPKNLPIVAWVQASRGLGFVASAVPLPYLEHFRAAADAAPEIEKDPWSLT